VSDPLFFAEFLPPAGERLVLGGDEARHAAASRRLRVGDTLSLFDGRGACACAALEHIERRGQTLELRVLDRTDMPPPQPQVHLACALPKGDRQSVLLDMATQLGMSRFTPLECERSVVTAGANSAARWLRICLEACKQSRRLHLPAIDASATPRHVAGAAVAAGQTVLVAHPSGRDLHEALSARNAAGITLLVGPEGGFSEREIAEIAASGATPVTLGSAILRIEAAAVAMLAATRFCPG
jgi:16S rRNA (uracil1498-N3)-methyltransferase